ncbi:MAG: hypothetical protein IKI72_09135 [Bacteroidales bacterium]|nr:hypothetical protein [Bacteroidales bacterium]
MGKFGNISIARYRRILAKLGLEFVRTKAGHEMWYKEGMMRNVVFQTHVDPVPEDIVSKNNKTIGVSNADFEAVLKEVK